MFKATGCKMKNIERTGQFPGFYKEAKTIKITRRSTTAIIIKVTYWKTNRIINLREMSGSRGEYFIITTQWLDNTMMYWNQLDLILKMSLKNETRTLLSIIQRGPSRGTKRMRRMMKCIQMLWLLDKCPIVSGYHKVKWKKMIELRQSQGSKLPQISTLRKTTKSIRMWIQVM